jgi:adenylate kinase family enzyme
MSNFVGYFESLYHKYIQFLQESTPKHINRGKQLAVVVGPPGAGKTTYSEILQKQMGAIFMDTDSIINEVGKDLPYYDDYRDYLLDIDVDDRDYYKEYNIYIEYVEDIRDEFYNNIGNTIIKEAIKNNFNIIMENIRINRDQLDIFIRNGYTISIYFIINKDIEELLNRVRQREVSSMSMNGGCLENIIPISSEIIKDVVGNIKKNMKKICKKNKKIKCYTLINNYNKSFTKYKVFN